MIRDIDATQPSLFRAEDFQTPFGGGLAPANRWVRWAEQIPWDALAGVYHQCLKAGGRPAKPARLVIGAMIIKHRLCLSDTETIEQLRENPYLQYFCGFQRYQAESAFAPTLFVKLRQRLGPERFAGFEQAVIEQMARVGRRTSKTSPTDSGGPPGARPQSTTDPATPPPTTDAATPELNAAASPAGTLIVDASVAEQKIRYPNDVLLLDEARRTSEALIDTLRTELSARQCSQARKPRDYRRRARRNFLHYSKQRSRSQRVRRRAARQQLQYLRRDLTIIDRLLDVWQAETVQSRLPLTHRMLRRLWVVRELYRQQAQRHRTRARRIDDRIVSLSQPHVRPIVRGRLGHPVEFGAKFSVGLNDGLACVDTLRWDAFSEAGDLIAQCRAYRARRGHYPHKVLADGAYGTRANRRWLKAHGIAFGGKPLGRPPRLSPVQQREIDRLRTLDQRHRIPIEGKFGQGKNAYGLAKIPARRADTSQAWIRAIFLVMNLIALAKAFFARYPATLTVALCALWAEIKAQALTARIRASLVGNRTDSLRVVFE